MTTPTPNDMPGAQQPEPQPSDAAPTPPTTGNSGPATGNNAPDAAPTPADQPDNRPPWEKSGEPFDPERAWNLIQNLKTENAQIKQRTDPIVAEWEQLRRASQTELERAQEDLARLTERETAWRQQAVRAKAESLAAARFVDADIALALVGDLSEYATDDGVDTAKLTARFDQLAAEKPILVTPPQPQGFAPNRGQGRSGTGPVTSAERAAHAESQRDWRGSFAAKTQQLMDLHNSSH